MRLWGSVASLPSPSRQAPCHLASACTRRLQAPRRSSRRPRPPMGGATACKKLPRKRYKVAVITNTECELCRPRNRTTIGALAFCDCGVRRITTGNHADTGCPGPRCFPTGGFFCEALSAGWAIVPTTEPNTYRGVGSVTAGVTFPSAVAQTKGNPVQHKVACPLKPSAAHFQSPGAFSWPRPSCASRPPYA